MKTPVYFGSAAIGMTPIDGLHECCCVLNALRTAIVEHDELRLGGDALYGLCTIIGAAEAGVRRASEELAAQRAGRGEQPRPEQESLTERVRAALREMQEHGDDPPAGTTYPKIATPNARLTAIAATARAGFAVTEIAQAVNMRKEKVELIIAQLRASGELPADGGIETPRAANA